jgi:radical SAM protein
MVRGMAGMDLDRSPLLVFWETTRACRLACRHCRAEAQLTPLAGELSTEEGRRLIGDLTGFGSRAPVLVLTGGDVLLRSDVFDLVAWARREGLPVALAPSVTPLLSTKTLVRMRDLGVTSVSISLDGATAATHEGIRGIPGHFDQTLAALTSLVELGFRVQVNTAVMAGNVEELADIAAIVQASGARSWEVFLLVKVGRGRAVGELSPQDDEDVAHLLVDASGYGFAVRTVEAPFFRRVASWRKQAGTDADPAERFGLGPLYRRLAARLRGRLGPPGPARTVTAGTRDGKGILFIAHDGQVFPAGFLPLALGNARERSVVDIYRHHPLLRSIRRAAFTGRCGSCEFRDLCGGSRARAYAAAGDPLGEDPACAYLPGTGAPQAMAAPPPAAEPPGDGVGRS